MARKKRPNIFARARPPVPVAGGRSVFKRSKPLSHPGKAPDKPSLLGPIRDWRHPRAAQRSALEATRENVRRALLARDADPFAVEVIVSMTPGRPYLLALYAERYERDPDEPPDNEDIVLQAMFVGSGRRLWARALSYADVGLIREAVVTPLAEGAVDRPLWDKDSIMTTEGESMGHGDFSAWRAKRKVGAPLKAGGGMTAAERRKKKARDRDRQRRLRKTETEIERLRSVNDFDGAQRLKRRRDAALKGKKE